MSKMMEFKSIEELKEVIKLLDFIKEEKKEEFKKDIHLGIRNYLEGIKDIREFLKALNSIYKIYEGFDLDFVGKRVYDNFFHYPFFQRVEKIKKLLEKIDDELKHKIWIAYFYYEDDIENITLEELITLQNLGILQEAIELNRCYKVLKEIEELGNRFLREYGDIQKDSNCEDSEYLSIYYRVLNFKSAEQFLNAIADSSKEIRAEVYFSSFMPSDMNGEVYEVRFYFDALKENSYFSISLNAKNEILSISLESF